VRGRAGTLALAACLGLAALAGAGSAMASTPAAAVGGWRAAEIYGVSPRLGGPGSYSFVTGLNAVSCADPGDCLTGGSYPRRRPDLLRPMTAIEADGAWGPARRLWLPPGPSNRDGEGQVLAVSCPTAHWCEAAGLIGRSYPLQYGPDQGRAFVATESDGSWSRPRLIGLPAGRAASGFGAIWGITCGRPGSCLAVGSYQARSPSSSWEPMAVTEAGGRWTRARERPAPAAARDTGAGLSSVSCPSPALCVAVGWYSYHMGTVFAVRGLEAVFSGGRWHRPVPVGTSASAPTGRSELQAVSCESLRFCLAVGWWGDGDSLSLAFRDGRWQPPVGVTTGPPGSYLPTVSSVSCTATACLGAGDFSDLDAGLELPFVMTYADGRWRDPEVIRLPRDAMTAAGDPGAQEEQLSQTAAADCVPDGASCTVVGLYNTRRGSYRGWAAAGRV
jgi:hypothetical protein